MRSDLTIRAARVNVTPTTAYPLGGFAARTGAARGAARSLEANALVLSAPTGRVVWISVDVLAITTPLRRVIVDAVARRCGYPSDDIIVVASHTHSAPAVWHGTIHPVLPANFDEHAASEVAELIADALSRTSDRPATACFGLAEVSGVGSNRHSPDGPADLTTGALLLTDTETAQSLAVVYDYACHPTVLGENNLQYTSDWVGGARERIRSTLNTDLPVLYLAGAGGDVSTRFLRRESTHAEADRLGGIVGEGVLDALSSAAALESPDVEVRRRVFRAPTRTSFRDVTRVGQAAQSSSRVASSIRDGESSRAAYLAGDVPRELEICVSLVRIGERSWFHTPFELGTTLARQIVADAPSTRIIGYTDGYDGYLADADSAAAGHYEASASYFDVETTGWIVTRMAQERGGMSTASS